MARVSQEHLDARRRQILDGAALCFARNGFHATSMQDVLKEVGLSAGAVYRYFSGKEELIGAIVGEVLDVVGGVFESAAEQSPPPLPDEMIPGLLATLKEARPGVVHNGEWIFPRLMLQVWTETLRNEDLAAIVHAGYARVRAAWVKVVEGYKDADLIAADADPDAMARVMIALAQGFAAQMAVFGEMPPEIMRDGLRAMVSMRDPAQRPEGSQLG
ncbi:TetR/AcrR family transcriptional regulator [Streptomyces azureus]|uniref:TetR family transcriptional regulator n=1 Tax=Streptomyces azureus TaxID=146537 RepID=A0A0K8PKE2_STRAJ|nr:TetR/AcrR family transcriptional regulator [Streptomyces azureus]GAP48355.1 TetR family transcriptional regulator [Streptomyces azureus]